MRWLNFQTTNPEHAVGTAEYARVTSYGYFHKHSRIFKLKGAYIQCAMFRITVNGLSVAETGPIGNEYDETPVYLCGAIPIESGSNKVQLEVQFVWYAPGTDRYIPSAAWNPATYESPGALALGDANVGLSGVRRDCNLSNIDFVVTQRKR